MAVVLANPALSNHRLIRFESFNRKLYRRCLASLLSPRLLRHQSPLLRHGRANLQTTSLNRENNWNAGSSKIAVAFRV